MVEQDPAAPVLIGRDAETALLADLIDQAREGSSGALVVHGEAGIGKTALLREATARASSAGFRVLRTRGLETESELAFAGLGDLLLPVADLVERIPLPQADAIRAALALGPPTGQDRFAVCAGTLSVLGEAAETDPVLVVIEDAQWLDRSSAEALGFAARRLDSEGIVMLIAVRDGEATEFDTTGLPEARLQGLGPEEAAELLGLAAPAGIPEDVIRALTDAVAGNPLALLELPSTLPPGQLAGDEPLDRSAIVPSVTAAFARRLRTLPEDTRTALLVAAADDTVDLDVISRACLELGVDPAALGPAEDAGLIEVGTGVEFRHPLLRAAALHEAPAGRRREAHGALAAAGAGASSRAWHLAAASVGDDENAAVVLDAAAADARARGGHAEAASALERAAGLSAPGPARAARLIAAAREARSSGNATKTLRLLAEALPLDDDPRARARVQHLRGAVEMWSGAPHGAHALLVSEADAVEQHDPERAARMLTDATWAALMAADLSGGVETGERARAVAENVGGLAAVAADAALGIAVLLGGDAMRAIPLLARYHSQRTEIESATGGASDAMPTPSAQVLTWLEQYDEARQVAVAAVESARARSALGALPYALTELADLEFRTGYWASATANATEAARIAAEIGQETVLAYALACVARIEGAKGDEAGCREHASRAIELGEHRIGAAVGFGIAAIGLLELGLGRPEEAADTLGWLAALAAERSLGEPNVIQWAPDYIEACIRAGRTDDAERELASFEQQAQRTGRSWAAVTAARCRGLLADDAGLCAAFETALALHDRVPAPFEHARTLLAYGERLRRARRRTDARPHLRDAVGIFERLGAEPWADRARRELAATGADPVARTASPTDELTPQELQVALVVAEGATNREAGARLFLSPKTVEAHLGRIYRKLGVRSRTELARMLATSVDASPGG